LKTTISYKLSNAGLTALNIYDINGKLIDQLYQEYQTPGNYKYIWNASTLPSGIYITALNQNGKKLSSQKLLLVK
jgi:hypothetical protein